MKLVIGLVGRNGSGKGTVAKLLKEKYGASVYRFSNVLRDVLDLLFLEKSREHIDTLSETLRKGFGEGILKHALVKKAEHDASPLIVLDGLRRLDDLHGLETLGKFVLVDVFVPPEIRYERLLHRGENAGESTQSFETFKQLEMAEPQQGISDLEKRADLRIDNSGTSEELEKRVDDMMKHLV